MNRREFGTKLGLLGAGTLAAVAGFNAATAASIPATTAIDPADRKEWTRQHYRGVENLLLPSFRPDLQTLDEDGIRLDVRRSIAHGFFGSSCAELGLDVATTTEFLRIACDEAKGKFYVGAIIEYPTLEENLALIKQAEAVGCSHAFLVYPSGLEPQSEADVLDYYRTLIEATKLGIVLYATPSANLRRFDPTGVPFGVFDKLVDMPTVAAMKLTQTINPVLAYQVCARYASRLTINCVHLDLLPLMARSFGVRWSGEWIAEAVQSPDKPYAVDFVNQLNQGNYDKATSLYWQLQPAYQAIFDLQAPLLRKGGHPWLHMKYYQWSVGGNGGLISVKGQTPDQIGTLTEAGRRLIRDTYRKIGITTVDRPESDFITGVVNAGKGILPAAYTDRPYYA